MQSFFIDWLSLKTVTAVGIVLFFKSLGDIAMNYCQFGQQENVQVSFIGLYLEYAIVNAYAGPCIILLQTMVDERASNFCIVIIFFIDNLMTMVCAPLLSEKGVSDEEYKNFYFN